MSDHRATAAAAQRVQRTVLLGKPEPRHVREGTVCKACLASRAEVILGQEWACPFDLDLRGGSRCLANQITLERTTMGSVIVSGLAGTPLIPDDGIVPGP